MEKRINLLCGHYGSGKTNIAVNFAIELKKNNYKVTIGDLDIVNPYFRTKDSAKDFENFGIRLVVSDFANSNLDIPALPSSIYSLVDDLDQKVVIDVGGDDRGALALGRISKRIIEEGDFDNFLVVNTYRPLTRTVNDLMEVMDEIEIASRLPFTGIINNSNLGAETTKETILSSIPIVEELSKRKNLKIKYTTVDKKLYDCLKGEIDNLFPLNLQNKIFEKR